MFSRVRIWVAIAAATAGIAAHAPHVLADPPNIEARVRTWLEQQLAQAPAIQRLSDLKISYTSRDYPRMTKVEYDLLVIESKKRSDPDDDIKLQLDAVPQRLGFNTFEHTVWWEKSGSWRFNTSYPNSERTRYHDVSVTKESAWQISSQQLTVLDPSRPAPNSYNLPSIENQINSDISQLIDAWLSTGLRGSPKLTRVTAQGTSWTATLDGEVVSQEISGRWDDAADRAFVERAVFVKTPHPDGPGLVITYSDWRPLPDNPSFWIAYQLTRTKPDGRKSREVVVNSIEPLDATEFRAVTKPPPATGSDPVRGKLTVTTVYDFGQGVRTDVDHATSSQKQTRVLPRLADEESRWQRIGWIALAGIVALLVGARLFRKSGHS